MVRGPLALGLLICALSGLLCASCVQASQRYPLRSELSGATSAVGSVSVERVEGGQRLVVVELRDLPAPERLAPGLTDFVVWLQAPSGEAVKAGALQYDREHQSGSLFATTTLASFTVQVTGERGPSVVAPSNVLLTQRKVDTNGSRVRGRASTN
jgi:hypothetical protein